MDRKSGEKNNEDRQAMRYPSAFDFSVLDEGPGPSEEPLSPDVEVNSMVKVTMADTTEHFGVIQWIGIPEGSKTERLVAGIEMENTLQQGATDGTFNKQRYFQCEPNKAIFVYLSRCRPDSRFPSQSQTFQLSKRQTIQAGEKNKEDQQAVRHSSSFDFSAFDGGPGPSNLPLSLDLDVNSMVEVTMADKTEYFGVIRWIGIPEGSKSERLVAGIELESSLSQGATDGIFNKQRYFQCEPNKAIFVFLSRCRPDSRFFSRSQTFQLSKRQTSQDNVLPGLQKRAQSLPSALYSSEAVQNPASDAVDDNHSLVFIGSASGNTFNFTQNLTVSGPTEQDKRSQWPSPCLGASEGLQRLLLSEDSVPGDSAQTTEQVLEEIDNLVQAVTLNAHTTRRKIVNLLCLNKEDSRNIEVKGSAD